MFTSDVSFLNFTYLDFWKIDSDCKVFLDGWQNAKSDQ